MRINDLEKDYLTVTDAAKLMDTSRPYAWFLVQTGKIKMRKVFGVAVVLKADAERFKRKTPKPAGK